MIAYFIATCPSCGKRFGWTGEFTQKPPCPRCECREDPEAMKRANEEIDRTRRKVLKDKGTEEGE